MHSFGLGGGGDEEFSLSKPSVCMIYCWGATKPIPAITSMLLKCPVCDL